jgi:predicted  nucleic acid-binding Zn-ribbon protein
MASQIIGRTGCPECGFDSAHVKRSDKCTYRYCPDCGSQYYARTKRQTELLEAKTRPVDAPAPVATATSTTGSEKPEPAPVVPAAAVPTPAAPPVPPAGPAPKRRGLFG